MVGLGLRGAAAVRRLAAVVACLSLACSGPSPTFDAGGRDAGTADGAGRDAAARAPVPARGSCPEGYEPGCVLGFAVCDGPNCPEGQVCSRARLCHLEMDQDPEECRLPNPDSPTTPGCPSGRACLVADGRSDGLCVTPTACDDAPPGWSCRFYDGSVYDDSAWSGACPPSFAENPYCGGVCGEEACPLDPMPIPLTTTYPPEQCVGLTATRPFGVCASWANGLGVIPAYETFVGPGAFAGIELEELPGTYFIVPLPVCLDYQSRVSGVACFDDEGNPY